MPVKFKPIYSCEGCGKDFEDENLVRTFKGYLTNGNGTRRYISSEKMYCLECLPLAVDVKNELPETVEIINEKNIKEIKIESFDEIKGTKIEQDYNNLKNEIKELQTSIRILTHQLENSKQDQTYGPIKVKLNFPEISEDEIIKSEPLEKITNEEEFPVEPPEELSFEASEIEEEKELTIQDYYKDVGEYLVLQKINSEEHENVLMKKCGCSSIDDLKKRLGNTNYKDLYYPLEKFIELEVFESIVPSSIHDYVFKIKNIMFGIPDIVKIKGHIFEEWGIALEKVIPIDKKKLDEASKKPLKKKISEMNVNDEYV
ncbi:hypothetical protein M0P25_03790 [archaeon]|nr:hypothetical protein [archaeon]MCK9439400.1 hypothetical protein [Patescibacteria group bacterium]